MHFSIILACIFNKIQIFTPKLLPSECKTSALSILQHSATNIFIRVILHKYWKQFPFWKFLKIRLIFYIYNLFLIHFLILYRENNNIPNNASNWNNNFSLQASIFRPNNLYFYNNNKLILPSNHALFNRLV